MSSNYKELYRKNKQTGEWERVGSPIDTYIFSGNPSDDTEVIVTNPAYRNESGETVKLYEALTQIDERLNKHDGNISYLAEHGGGGGSGTGSTGNYKIELTNITPVDGYYYAQSSSVTIDFRFTGGNSSSLFQYRIIYDGAYINGSDYKKIGNRTIVSITIPDINAYSTQTPHIFMIDALDPYGFGIDTYTLKISETSVILKANTVETLNIADNGKINVTITNKIINCPTTLLIENLTVPLETPYTYTYTSKSTGPTTIQIPLIGNVIQPSGVETGKQYNLKMYVQATMGTTTIESNVVYPKVNFVGGNQVCVVFENIATLSEYSGGTESKFASGEPLLFNFSLFYGTGDDKTPIYYAVRLDNPYNEAFRTQYPYGLLLLGNYFDENLHKEGCTGKTDNENVTNGTNKGISWNIPNTIMYKDTEGWLVTVRGWAGNGQWDNVAAFDITEGNTSRFPIQIPTRSQQTENDTLLAQWGNNTNFPTISTEKEWKSYTESYTYLKTKKETLPSIIMNVYNTNGSVSGFDSSSELPRLRFQNNAYGLIDFSEYSEELQEYTKLKNGGFSVSITFLSDKHPSNDKTVFLFGENDTNGDITSGIKITLEDVYWIIRSNDINYTLHTKIQQNVLNTIDFVLKPLDEDGTSANAKILINGVVNASDNVTSYENALPTKAYLGCDYVNKVITNYSDVNIYDLKIFSKYVGDLECVVNAKDAKLGNISWTTTVEEEYTKWKRRNFIYTDEETPEIPLSRLYENGEYLSPSFPILTGNTPPLPILLLEAPDIDNGFSKDTFYKPYEGTSATAQTFEGFKFHYYDPKLGSVSTTEVGVSLQGTSTLTYKDKNLEIKFLKVIDEATNKTELFQPKKDWMPEAQFTLKADVVDSAHANNTAIGYWINNKVNSMLEENPAMLALKENIPQDVYTKEGTKYTGETAHTDVKIRHTLEGFPIILLVKFAKEASATLLGIYSFNMGRYSYYNMGFKFFESFTRRNESTSYEDKGCPAVIDEYEINSNKIVFSGGEIDQSQIASYELNSDGDDNTSEHPTWSQDDLSILQHIGEFKYNGSTSEENAWNSLKTLFTYTAKCLQKYPYIWKDGTYKKNSDNPYVYEGEATMNMLDKCLSFKNAIGYFDVAVGLGMVDSLGKNLTLRTWGDLDPTHTTPSTQIRKWYTCFYDMDTALKLTNTGSEEVLSNVYIDIFKNKANYTYKDPESGQYVTTQDYRDIPFDEETKQRIPYTETWDKTDGPNTVVTYANLRPDEGKGFGSYNSGLWNILRDTLTFKKDDPRTEKIYYEDFWVNLRRNIIPTENSFINIITNNMGECGEMIYNSDFNEKYISEYKSSSVQAKGNISMLHGTRVETIRSWLKDRFTYLDGVLPLSSIESSLPYYKMGTLVFEGSGGIDEFYFNVSSPVFLIVNIGQGKINYIYKLDAYTDNRIITPYLGATSEKQTTINAIDIITNIDGLNSCRFSKFGDQMVLPSLTKINVKGTTTLSNNPIDFQKVFITTEGETTTSNIKDVNLASTKSNGNYVVNLDNFNKLTNVDISNSNVQSLSLPSSPLMTLSVNNSEIAAITVTQQPNIKTLNFEGCKNMTTIYVNNCEGLESINLNNLDNILSINIAVCKGVKEIICENNTTLTSITINNMASLEKISLNGCSNSNLKIKINDVSSLKTLDFSGIECSGITITSPSDLTGVTSLSLKNCINLKGFDFGEGIEVYKEEYVLDLSYFKSITNETLDIDGLGAPYIRFSENPFTLVYKYFYENAYIKRIFGNFIISGNSIFTRCENYTITGPDEVTEDKYKTNFTINVGDLTSCFSDTNCNINDVYYLLGVDSFTGVTIMDELFSGCYSIITDSIKKDLFKNCGNITSMDGIFNGCTGIEGYLPSATYNEEGIVTENGLLTPLINLERFNYIFSGNVEIDNNFFGPLRNEGKLKITEIKNFNPSSSSEYAPEGIYDHFLLTNLPDLEIIYNSFNNLQLLFPFTKDEENHLYCPLFYNNTKLVSIINSFKSLEYTTGDIINLLGGDDWSYELTNHFPQGLEEFIGSFTIDRKTKGGKASEVSIEINGNFFRKSCKTLIKYGTSDDERYLDPYYGNFYELEKYFVHKDGFPYNVFKGCINLEICSIMFNEIIGVDITDEERHDFTEHICTDEEENNPFILPSNDMFKDCIKLRLAPYLFSNMKGFLYKLNGLQFANCKLTNLNYVFSDTNSIRRGMIPYGLFFQGYNNNGDYNTYLEYMENALAGSKSQNLLCYNDNVVDTGYTIDEATGLFKTRNEFLVLANKYYNPTDANSTPYLWNIYLGDGTNVKINEFNEEVSGLTFIDSGVTHNLLPSLPEELGLNYINQEYPGSIAPKVAIKELYGILNVISGDTKINTRRYFCPPDIYKYTSNKYYTNINGTFNGCGNFTENPSEKDAVVKGVYGTIPPYIFTHLTKVKNFSNIFNGCIFILPYKWDNIGEKTVIEEIECWKFNGITIPPSLFSGLTEVTNISGLFGGLVWMGGTSFDSNIFSGLTNLTNVSSLFSSSWATWIESVSEKEEGTETIVTYPTSIKKYPQLPMSILTQSEKIENVSGFLNNIKGKFHIDSSLFTMDKHIYINDCNNFMYRCEDAHGNVPQFWEFNNYLNNTMSYDRAYSYLTQSYIDNYSSIPQSMKTI